MMTLLIGDSDVRSVFDWPAAIEALRLAYSADENEARFPGRSIARGEAGWLRVLSGVPGDGGLMGAKIIAAAPRAGRVSYLIALFDQASTELVALVDGNAITGFRTAATSALAVDLLAGQEPLTVGVLGSGFEAAKHLRAIGAARPVAEVRVYSPRAESRERFVAEFADLGVPVVAAPEPRAAVTGSSLVVCAARSRDETPILLGEWLEPGMTVVSLAGLVGGRVAGRTSQAQIALYKSVGSALQDLAIATMCVRAADEAGLGTRFAVPIDVVRK